jgi:hypothetical protein
MSDPFGAMRRLDKLVQSHEFKHMSHAMHMMHMAEEREKMRREFEGKRAENPNDGWVFYHPKPDTPKDPPKSGTDSSSTNCTIQ